MAFSAVAFIAPNYRDFKNYWLKAYNPGTTTPKVMALDATGTVQVAKLQLNANGFIVSAGQALVVPYIDGPYDLWLFPTSTEADANNTSNAKRVADNIEAIGSTIINDLSQAYEFKTKDLMKSSLIVFPVGKKLTWNGYDAESDGGGNWGIVTSGAHVDDGGEIFTLADGKYVKANLKGKRISALKYGVRANDLAFNSSPSVDSLIAHINSLTVPRGIHFPEGEYNLKAGLTNNIVKDNTTVSGSNAIIHCELGDVFVFGDAGFATRPRKVYAKGLEFTYATPLTNTTGRPLKFYNVIFGGIEDIVSDNCPSVYELVGQDSNSRISNFTVRNIKGNTANVAYPAQRVKNASVINLYDIVLLNNITLPPDDTTTLSTALFGNSFVSFEGDLDTIYANNFVGNRYERTLTGGAAIGEAQINFEFDRLIADYSASFGVRIVNAGSMGNWVFNDPYLRGSDGKGLYWETTATGTTNNVHVEKPYTVMCGTDGIVFTSILETRCDDIAINDPRSVGCNRLQSGGDDVRIERSSVDVTGGYVGKSSSGILAVTGGPVQGENGISISDDTVIYSVTNLRAGGTVASYDLPAHVAGSKDRLVAGNRVIVGSSVLNRPEYATLVADAIPATGVPYTNKNAFDISVYTRSQTGSPFAATINIDGIVVHNRSDFQGILHAGQTITITYGSALGWVLVGNP
jgi:hypothetical protein